MPITFRKSDTSNWFQWFSYLIAGVFRLPSVLGGSHTFTDVGCQYFVVGPEIINIHTRLPARVWWNTSTPSPEGEVPTFFNYASIHNTKRHLIIYAEVTQAPCTVNWLVQY